jgi:malate dehydrogenase (oxaloacetate-decarboxylating)(NADP+)
VVLDVGTNNPALLKDKFYLGLQRPRLQGSAYYQVVDEFINAAVHRWPNVLIQFEDFSSDKAQTILNKYRNDVLCFNDDIQGTGATSLAGILGALRAKGESPTSLGDQRILIAGAGSAGMGVAQVLYQAMIEHGRSPMEAKNCFFVADEKGLLAKDRLASLSPEQATFARDDDGGLSLREIVNKYKPTMILGMTAVGGLFTEDLIRDMARHCERPIIFPLSNPTSKAECTAEQAVRWTDGRCIFASGSPFDPVEMDNGKMFYPTQCNNMFGEVYDLRFDPCFLCFLLGLILFIRSSSHLCSLSRTGIGSDPLRRKDRHRSDAIRRRGGVGELSLRGRARPRKGLPEPINDQGREQEGRSRGHRGGYTDGTVIEAQREGVG